jgi:hypothetical protein
VRDWLEGRRRIFRADERLVALSRLFDMHWYVAHNPEAADFHGGPLRHFMRIGAAAMRDPNPYFDAAWYCARHPEAHANPLVHYLKQGAAAGLRPSHGFDPAWYRETYPDVVAADMEPLGHFLDFGMGEGRLPKESEDYRAVEEAELICLKAPMLREATAIFATHTTGRWIKPHVKPYLEALKSQGLSTTLIVAADTLSALASEELIELADGLYIRETAGYDFAAWAHVTRVFDFSKARLLCLVNDSVLGPLNIESFATLFARIGASHAHLIGLTESLEIARHFQSYFLIVKDDGVATLLDHLGDVISYANQHAVTISYEIPLVRQFLQKGLRVEALFPALARGNPMIEDWRKLIERGLPFVKVASLQFATENWREILKAQGYDPRIAEATIDMLNVQDACCRRLPQPASLARQPPA